MSVLVRSFRNLGPFQSATLALVLAACATSQEPDNNNNGGTSSTAGSGGAAGSAATAGATSGGTGGNATAGTAGTGTVTTAGKGGTGGTSSTGGSAGTAGTSTTGGSSPGTCPQYTGARTDNSAIFMNGFGQSTMGTWSGYGFTYKYGTAMVTPGEGNGCFAAAKFCANGTVPADDNSGAGLGWNIAQMNGSMTKAKAAITTPVKITFAGVAAGMRVQLAASMTVSYCYTLTAAEATAGTATIPLASFKTECWDTTGIAYDGVVPIEAIQLAVPGSTTGTAQTFDMCVLDVEPG